jgi:PAS domain S-box-containing protein
LGTFVLATGSIRLVSAKRAIELSRRPSRLPNFDAENAALVDLAEILASAPEHILQTLAEIALRLCKAHSAGLSLLEDADQHRRFHWRAIAGKWSGFVGGGTPRDFGPCGTVLDLNEPLLFSHPEQDFPYFNEATPVVEDSLLVPFYVDGEARGTIWVVAHDETKRFDAEDLRVMTNLSKFASAAYQTVLSADSRDAANDALQEAATTAQRFAFIVDSSDDAIVSKTLEGIITSWNKSAERIFGYPAEEALGQPITMLIPPDRIDEEVRIIESLRRGERVAPFDTIRLRKDGTQAHVSVTISPVRDISGKIVGASKIARDISERIQAQEQQSLLMREMRHRVSNLFMVTNAIVSLSARLAKSPAEMARSVQDRLSSLTRAHALTRPGLVDSVGRSELETSLGGLIASIFEPYADDQSEVPNRFTLTGGDLQISEQSVTNLALVLHELATNSAKYGALSQTGGMVRISSSLDDESLALTWTEEGGPEVTGDPEDEGFGGVLTRQVIVNQFNGKLERDWEPSGLRMRIEIPLRHLRIPTAAKTGQ